MAQGAHCLSDLNYDEGANALSNAFAASAPPPDGLSVVAQGHVWIGVPGELGHESGSCLR